MLTAGLIEMKVLRVHREGPSTRNPTPGERSMLRSTLAAAPVQSCQGSVMIALGIAYQTTIPVLCSGAARIISFRECASVYSGPMVGFHCPSQHEVDERKGKRDGSILEVRSEHGLCIDPDLQALYR